MKEQNIGNGFYAEVDEYNRLTLRQHSYGRNLWMETLDKEATQNLFELLRTNLKKDSSGSPRYKHGLGDKS